MAVSRTLQIDSGDSESELEGEGAHGGSGEEMDLDCTAAKVVWLLVLLLICCLLTWSYQRRKSTGAPLQLVGSDEDEGAKDKESHVSFSRFDLQRASAVTC